MTAKFDRRSVLKLGGGMLAASALLPHQAFAQQTAINYWHTFTSQSAARRARSRRPGMPVRL